MTSRYSRSLKLNATNLLLALYLLASLLAFAYAISLLVGRSSSPFTHSDIHYQIGATAFAIMFFTSSLFLKNIIKTYILIFAISATGAVYAAEAYLQFVTPKTDLHQAFLGKPENRITTPLELLAMERAKGEDAWLSGEAIKWAMYNTDTLQTEFIPFAGISQVRTIGCEEGPHTLIYASDRHGFNNFDHVWDNHEIDVLAVGDSYTYGSCVPTELNMVDRIRQVHDRTINLGSGGNGSILNLGALREYGPHLKPKIVLWFFFQNDLDSWESLITTANRYLNEPNFTQNLISRQDEIDEHWKTLYTRLESQEKVGRGALYTGTEFGAIIKLTELRQRLGLTDHMGWLEGRAAVTQQAVKRADELVQSWGGELIFIYLPDNYFYLPHNERIMRDSKRVQRVIMQSVSDIGVASVDLTDVFESHPNPYSLFGNPQTRSHYGATGYNLVAQTLLPIIGEKLARRPH